MSQPQLSVREKAREMFDEIFSQKKTPEGRSYLYDKEAECSVNPLIMKDFIDQIITLAQEEKEKEIIICSAIEMANGEIIRGHRHHNCINTARDIPRLKEMQIFHQGFMTSKNRFVERGEAYKIFVESGAVSVDEAVHPMKNRNELYSEDLY